MKNDFQEETMDYRENGYEENNRMRNPYLSMTGRIVSIEAAGFRGIGANDCQLRVGVETVESGLTNFIVSPSTYVVNFETLQEGMMATFYHRADVPVPMIYPPQYNAVVVAPQMSEGQVFVGRFNASLISEDMGLQLNMSGDTKVVTTNNQVFKGNIANHDLVVVYRYTTRSIPPQTTPEMVVVLCGQGETE
ncbi:MAG: hypothetical protein IJN16_01585 [Lachnospiraceae bacterium]|nr:hypothetical protein [Lachnospiraceae bacterium]